MSSNVLDELAKVGSVYTDKHFVYTTGQHGPAYINFDPLFPNVSLVRSLCEQLVAPFAGHVDTVVAPATGGIALAVLSADALSRSEGNVSLAWADKDGKEFQFERNGFVDAITNKRVLVVEDLLNTGGSVAKVCRLVEQHGGELVGASVIVNRGASTAETLQIPRLEALATVTFSSVPAGECELCKTNVPIITDIGHGGEYQAEHPDYPGGYNTVR